MEDTGADWLKWDSNWWGVCTCTNHGHSASDGEFYQVQGVHAVLAELRRRFPSLMIENCAGGGTRTDFAMLANSHVTWLHDSSTPSRRVRFHLAGANYLFPPEMCNTFIVDADDEPLTDPATPAADIDAIARSRMLGAFGISARLPQWTETALAAVAGCCRPVQGDPTPSQTRPLLPPAAADRPAVPRFAAPRRVGGLRRNRHRRAWCLAGGDLGFPRSCSRIDSRAAPARPRA